MVVAVFCGDVDCGGAHTQTDDVISPCPPDSFRPEPLLTQDGCCVVQQRSRDPLFSSPRLLAPPVYCTVGLCICQASVRLSVCLYVCPTIGWRRGVVVSGVRRLNEVNARRARLVPGWVTVFGRVYHLGM